MKRQIIAAALLLSLLFSACSKPEDKKTDTPDVNETTVQSTTSELDARKNVLDGLPEKKFDGKEYKILMRDEWAYEFEAEEQTGETVNDAVYLRNTTVEDRFDVKIKPIRVLGNWENQDKFLTTLRKSVAAGDNAFDIVAGYEAYMPKTMLEGLYLNWKDIPYVDFDKPWWSKDAADELTVGGNLYMATGDIALTLWKYMFCFLFNKQVQQDNDIEDPYKLVNEGKWTLDKVSELSKKVYKDLNGNGEADKDDMFGLGCGMSVLVDNYIASCDIPVTVRDSEGMPQIAVNTPRMISLIEKLYSMYYETKEIKAEPLLDTVSMLSTDRLLFMTGSFELIERLRNMNTNFGILPYPKYDEAQEKYHGTTVDGLSFFCIPKTEPDPEFVGIITEAMCAESYKQVVPAFYDVMLKTKLSRDGESSQMLDIIRDGVVFNFGYVFSYSMESVGHLTRVLLYDKKKDFASFYEKKEQQYQKLLEKLLAKLTE